MAIKIVGFVKKRPDLTFEQFKEYWLTKHSILEKDNVANNPVRKIVASFPTEQSLRAGYGDQDRMFDGMVELYFANMEDLQKHMSTGQREVMRKDEENFIDLTVDPVFILTEEYVMAEKTPRETGV